MCLPDFFGMIKIQSAELHHLISFSAGHCIMKKSEKPSCNALLAVLKIIITKILFFSSSAES